MTQFYNKQYAKRERASAPCSKIQIQGSVTAEAAPAAIFICSPVIDLYAGNSGNSSDGELCGTGSGKGGGRRHGGDSRV